jgi:hypothetical protein
MKHGAQVLGGQFESRKNVKNEQRKKDMEKLMSKFKQNVSLPQFKGSIHFVLFRHILLHFVTFCYFLLLHVQALFRLQNIYVNSFR